MAGAFIAIGACTSALTKNQVIAFVVAAAACFLFLMSGLDLVLAAFRPWAPPLVVDTVASFSFLTHFGQLTKGVLDAATLLFFGSLIVVCLLINTLLVDLEKAA
jgi:ABC-2 type transport system permease protein